MHLHLDHFCDLKKMIFDDNNIVKYTAAHQKGNAQRPRIVLSSTSSRSDIFNCLAH